MFDQGNLISAAFKIFLGRAPEQESIAFWADRLNGDVRSIEIFLNFIRQTPEFERNLDVSNSEYLLRLIYQKSGRGSSEGDPFTINTSKYRVFFMHIPKTAGISIVHNIARLFHPLQIKAMDFESNLPNGPEKFLVGHYSINQIPEISKNIIKIISIREPRERIVSMYHFLPNVPWTNLHWGAAAKAASTLSFKEFLCCEDPLVRFTFDNYYCRVLSGTGVPGQDLYRSPTPVDLDLAEKNFANFDYTVRVEDLKENSIFDQKMWRDLERLLDGKIDREVAKLNTKNPEKKMRDANIQDVPINLISYDNILLKKYYPSENS